MSKVRTFLGTLILPLLLLLTLFVSTGNSPQPAAIHAQSGVSNFTTVSASRDVLAGRDVILGGFLTVEPSASVPITNNSYLTPTTTFVPLTASAAITTSGARIAVQPAGTLLVLLNVGSNDITFTETGTLISAGNIILGANDSATLLSNGTNWYQIAASNN